MASKPDPFNDLRDASNLSSLYESLSRFYREAGNQAQAEGMAARRTELWQAWDRKLPKNGFVLRQLSALN